MSMYDSNLLVWASATLATSIETVGQTAAGATATINLGAGRVDGTVFIDVDSIYTGATDNYFKLALRGAKSSSWSTTMDLANIELGASDQLGGNQNSTAGIWELPFTTERDGEIYSHVRFYGVGVGTMATGVTFSAWLGK